MKKIVLATTNPEISQREKSHNQIARRIAQEGIVLLKNDDMLPIKNKKIALYGSGARQTVSGGTGSGAMHPRRCVGIEEGFINASFDILTTSWLDRYDDFYNKNYKTWRDKIESKVEGVTDLYKILHEISHDRFVYPTGILIEDNDLFDDADNAIYVIARQAGEGADRKIDKADYLIDDIEYENIKKIRSFYKKVCIVINVGGFIDLSKLDELNIDSIVYYAQGGQDGGNALVDIISGKISPSAKLTATWPMDIYDYPSTKEFSHLGNPKVQNYKEDIFVGYRYFDTFNIKPRFSFGFGLSYTEFDLKPSVQLFGENVYVKCDVENMGNFPSKEVVQVYVSIPKENAENKRLVAFAKSEMIGLSGKETVNLSFSVRDLAWYDEKRASYILSKGEYIVHIGNSCDNTKPTVILEAENEVVIEQCINISSKIEDFEQLHADKKKQDYSNLHRFIINTKIIKTKINTYEERKVSTDKRIKALLDKMSNEELASIVIGAGTSNSEEERLVNVMGASGSSTSSLFEKFSIPNAIFSDGPAGLNVTPRVVEMPDGELKTADAYPQYDFGFFGKIMHSKMIAKPEDGICHYQYATAWPAGVVRAQTWNTSLMGEMGVAVGKEMEEFGVTCWLAPGMNITRNTLCGRTFEYYSEDPVLSGELAAATVIGVQKQEGKGVSIKHFACNNSEFERTYSTSNLSERALREIYLKGFEIAVKKSNPMTVMASYNMVNGVYSTNNYDLLVKVLRNEWGFKNSVISDWDAVRFDRGDISKANYSGCDLVMPGSKKQINELADAITCGKANKDDVLRSAENILKIVKQNTILTTKGI